MKIILLALVAAALAYAQPAPTSIVGPIYTQTGGLYTGSFTVQSQAKTNTGWAIAGCQIAGSPNPCTIVYVTAGAIGALSLVPNDTSTPNLTSYLMTFANGDIWTCIVPTSATPIPWTQACTPQSASSAPPNVAQSISPSQVIPGTANGFLLVTSNGLVAWGSLADLQLFPAANCVAGTGGTTWSTSLMPACIGESNNIGGWLPFADASTAQFTVHLPRDWDGTEPFISLLFDTATNTSGTIIFQAQTGCSRLDGTTSDNPSFSTAQIFSAATAAAANRAFSEGLQFNAITAVNNCVPNSMLIVKITRSTDTAGSVVGVLEADVTIGRTPLIQSN